MAKKTSRKISLGILYLIQYIRIILFKIISNNKNVCLEKCKLFLPTQFVGLGNINITQAVIGCFPSPLFISSYGYIEARSIGSKIIIGQRTFLNNNFSIIADRTQISIGCDCLIGINFSVMDSDFHGLELSNRRNGLYDCKEVIIHDNVFIGNNVTILKGVVIGYGCVIANNSVVNKSFPPNSIIGGVPAKYISSVPN